MALGGLLLAIVRPNRVILNLAYTQCLYYLVLAIITTNSLIVIIGYWSHKLALQIGIWENFFLTEWRYSVALWETCAWYASPTPIYSLFFY